VLLNVKISIVKTKIMAFQLKYPIRSKISVYSHITEQVKCFKYLGFNMAHENEKAIGENSLNYNGIE